MNNLVSIVMPIYNSSKYLKQCLDSLINQTLKDIEIICVDDGSTDNSVEIINSYIVKDNRIKLLKQKNQGAGIARNNGMELATGEYIIFLDSDDIFKPNMLKSMYKIAKRKNAEIVISGFYIFDDINGISEVVKNKNKETLNYLDIFYYSYNAPWNKLLLRSFIVDKKIKFINTKTGQDMYFSKLSILSAKKVVFIKKCLQFYRTNNENSLQGNKKIDGLLKDSILALTSLKEELINRNLFSSHIKYEFYSYANYIINSYFNKINNIAEKENAYKMLKKELFNKLFDNINYMDENSFVYIVNKSEKFEDFLMNYHSNENNRITQESLKFYKTIKNTKNLVISIKLKIINNANCLLKNVKKR